jgi:O-acetyl-ADP-ribose deacetylase (regulator of RNase III)
MRITLIDLHGSLTDAAHACGWDSIETKMFTDVRDMSRLPGTAFVSPANSFGMMDGGIDFVYSRLMFPGLETVVRQAIAAHGCADENMGIPSLAIGKAIALVIPENTDIYMVIAPTMLLPQDVRGTHNAYHAMYATLKAVHDVEKITHLVVPGLCTGCGMMDASVAVKQMQQAHIDFMEGRPPTWTLEQVLAEQPCPS